MAEEHTLHAQVLTPEGEVFNGEVQQLSTRTKVGEIGILANHVPVLARLQPTELRLHIRGRRDASATRRPRAGSRSSPTSALVLVGEAIAPDQLDEAAASADRGRRGAHEGGRGGLRRPRAGRAGQARGPRPSWRSPSRLTDSRLPLT